MTKKPFIFLVLASILFAVGWLAFGWAGAGLDKAQAGKQAVEKAEKDLADLKAQLALWEQAGQRTVASVQPVALEAKFAPHELPKTAELLAGLYADRGYFNLRSFSLSWGEAEGSGSVAQMSVTGEKVFVGGDSAAVGGAQ